MDNEYSGRSVEEAIEKGLKELNTTRENVEIKILNEGKSGLFGLMGSQPALVKIIPKDSKESEKKGDSEDNSKNNLEEILKRLGVSANVVQEIDGEEIVLNVSTANPAVLIGKGGKTLEALQYLLRLMTKDRTRESRVTLDVENYMKKHKEKIKKMVEETAAQLSAMKEGEKHLPPMSPSERRFVHLLLQDNKEVGARSEGADEERHIVIYLRAADTA